MSLPIPASSALGYKYFGATCGLQIDATSNKPYIDRLLVTHVCCRCRCWRMTSWPWPRNINTRTSPGSRDTRQTPPTAGLSVLHIQPSFLPVDMSMPILHPIHKRYSRSVATLWQHTAVQHKSSSSSDPQVYILVCSVCFALVLIGLFLVAHRIHLAEGSGYFCSPVWSFYAMNNVYARGSIRCSY